MLALLDHLQLETGLLVGYDIGSRVAQTVAQIAPQRVQGLALSAPVYPGFGTRPLEPAAQKERWYQHFHTIAQADQLIGHDREEEYFPLLVRVQMLAGIGHFVPFEAPDTLVEAISALL